MIFFKHYWVMDNNLFILILLGNSIIVGIQDSTLASIIIA
jgi:hypothetical protein